MASRGLCAQRNPIESSLVDHPGTALIGGILEVTIGVVKVGI